MDVRKVNNPEHMPVSTGNLPDASLVQNLVDAAYARFEPDREGIQADYYPALSRVPADLFGICLAGIDGVRYSAGDALYPFTIMSVSMRLGLNIFASAPESEVHRNRKIKSGG